MGSKIGVWIFVGIIFLVLIVGFFLLQNGDNTIDSNTLNSVSDGFTRPSTSNLPFWMTSEFRNVISGETFRISDFKGKPILLESFAVWCPTCTREQEIVKELHEELGDSFISISLDTDPEEDEARVIEHVQSNGFTWRYAISPVETTRNLISEFGSGIVNAPSVPMILVCENQEYKKLGNGLKTKEKLKEELESCGG